MTLSSSGSSQNNPSSHSLKRDEYAKNVTQIFMFRHGETEWNVQQRFQGHINVPLNEKGWVQAHGLVPFFVAQQIEVILSSDLSRTVQTAQPIADALQVEIFRTELLREAFLGEAQGLTREEMLQRFGPETVGRWRSSLVSDADVSYPGGESANQILQRSFRAIEDFIKANAYSRIAVSTHGGVVRRIMHRLLPLDTPPVPTHNGVVYELYYDRRNGEFSAPLRNPVDLTILP